MAADNIVQNNTSDKVIVLALDTLGLPVLGETLDLIIRDINSNEFFNGTVFAASFASVTMIETDAVNCPGYYHFDITSADRELLYKADAPGTEVKNGPFNGSAQFVPWIDWINTTRKYARNRVDCDAGRYSVFEDDQTTIFESGDATISQRKPDNIP